MKALPYVIIIALVIALLATHEKCQEAKSISDTVYITDTMEVDAPRPYDSSHIGIKLIKVPVIINKSNKEVGLVTNLVTGLDTSLVTSDSVEVIIPITQKHYKDSLYDIYISGLEPHLDSLRLYPKTTIITTEKIQYRQRKWNVSIQAGYGYGRDGFSPYIGVGVGYTLFSF